MIKFILKYYEKKYLWSVHESELSLLTEYSSGSFELRLVEMSESEKEATIEKNWVRGWSRIRIVLWLFVEKKGELFRLRNIERWLHGLSAPDADFEVDIDSLLTKDFADETLIFKFREFEELGKREAPILRILVDVLGNDIQITFIRDESVNDFECYDNQQKRRYDIEKKINDYT